MESGKFSTGAHPAPTMEGQEMTAKKKPALSPTRKRAFAAVEKFRAIVKREGWTQEETVKKSGFNLNTTGRWLRGAHAPTSRIMIEALEKFNAKHANPPGEKTNAIREPDPIS
jgi:hypothetical protein